MAIYKNYWTLPMIESNKKIFYRNMDLKKKKFHDVMKTFANN